MPIQQGQCTVFKQNCLSGKENFAAGTSYVYKIALYTANADLSYATLAYTTTNEVAGGLNYTAITNGILQGAVNTDPGKTLFVTTTIGGRPLGDINNTGTVTSADSLAYLKWSQGVNTDPAQVAWIEGTLNPYIFANPITYAAYLNGAGANGYTTGGQILTPIVPASLDQTAYVSFNNVTWNPASFTCRGALIYNSTTNAAVAVLDFGSDKTCSGTFTVTFPTASSTTAIIRFS
jgi:hypothetical protein